MVVWRSRGGVIAMELAGYRVVTPRGVVDNGVVRIEGERITSLLDAASGATSGAGPSAGPTAGAMAADPGARPRRWLVPGFVDIHVHGGGGATFTDGDPDAARAAAAFHLRHGTTSL